MQLTEPASRLSRAFSLFLVVLGRLEEAMAEYQKAIRSPGTTPPARPPWRAAARAPTPPLSTTGRRPPGGQALDWLRADLAAWGKQAQSDKPPDRTTAQVLRHWPQGPNLAGVRDPAALAKLPETERQGWQMLWQKAEAVLAKSGAMK
jgi:hypothetical protein